VHRVLIFDERPFTGHNSGVIRLALGALVLAAGLFAAIVPMRSALLLTGDTARPGTAAQGAENCTDSDSGGEWNAQRDVVAPAHESAWKWRSLHAAFAALPSPAIVIDTRTIAPSQPRAPAATPRLLHTPLLI
jgi:hypothetical protein